VINGNATQAEIARAFEVHLVTVKRYVKLCRQGGVPFSHCQGGEPATKSIAEVCQQAQCYLIGAWKCPRRTTTAGDYVTDAGSCLRKTVFADGDACDSHR
jgi:hypothetical protein